MAATGRRWRERGTVTAEVAVLLPGVVLMLALVLSTAAVAVAHLRCQDAARSAVRLAARGEPQAAVVAAARIAAPAGARIAVSVAGGLVTVRVDAAVEVPLPGVPRFPVTAGAVARPESAP